MDWWLNSYMHIGWSAMESIIGTYGYRYVSLHIFYTDWLSSFVIHPPVDIKTQRAIILSQHMTALTWMVSLDTCVTCAPSTCVYFLSINNNFTCGINCAGSDVDALKRSSIYCRNVYMQWHTVGILCTPTCTWNYVGILHACMCTIKVFYSEQPSSTAAHCRKPW